LYSPNSQKAANGMRAVDTAGGCSTVRVIADRFPLVTLCAVCHSGMIMKCQMLCSRSDAVTRNYTAARFRIKHLPVPATFSNIS